jgi:hypothetical protein
MEQKTTKVVIEQAWDISLPSSLTFFSPGATWEHSQGVAKLLTDSAQ